MNFALEGTVELRVRDVLEEKLARILEEFGVDKLADVLNSEEGGVPFEELFAQAIIAPEEAEQRAAGFRRRDQAAGRGGASGFKTAQRNGAAGPFCGTEDRKPSDAILDREDDPRLLRSQERLALPSSLPPLGYDLRWPNGDTLPRCRLQP